MKLLLVEDDRMHATYMQGLVESALPEVETFLRAEDGNEGTACARREAIDAIVMDLRMRERNGIDAARTIWAERPTTRILFWSNYSDDAYLRGISRIVPPEAAYGYVLKTATPERTSLALRSVLIEAQIFVDRKIHRSQSAQQMRTDLSESDREILLDIAIGLTDKLIAERRFVSMRTVQNRLIGLYDKLNDASTGDPALDSQMNKRTRTISRALQRDIITVDDIKKAEGELASWQAGKRTG